MELENLLKEYIEKSERTWIIYDIDRGEIEHSTVIATLLVKNLSVK